LGTIGCVVGEAVVPEVRLLLEPRPKAAGRARRALRRAGLHEDVAHTAELLVTELVANALRHAVTDRDQRLVLLARLDEDFAHVGLAAPGLGFERARVTPGLGLRLLDQLAARWDVRRTLKGHLVWFEVDRRPTSPTSPGRP
jgi:two-component sensor histidine kinase